MSKRKKARGFQNRTTSLEGRGTVPTWCSWLTATSAELLSSLQAGQSGMAETASTHQLPCVLPQVLDLLPLGQDEVVQCLEVIVRFSFTFKKFIYCVCLYHGAGVEVKG